MLRHPTSVNKAARGRQKDEITDDEGKGESGKRRKPIDEFAEEGLKLGANRMLDPKLS